MPAGRDNEPRIVPRARFGAQGSGNGDWSPAEEGGPDPRARRESRRRTLSRRRLIGMVAALTAVGGFAAAAWYATTEGRKDPSAVVPIIKAERDPVKVRPAQPGGLEVPNQDKLIFDRFTAQPSPPKVESLLPAPETPLEKPKPDSATVPPTGPLAPEAPLVRPRGAQPEATAKAQPESKPAPKAKPKARPEPPAKPAANGAPKPAAEADGAKPEAAPAPTEPAKTAATETPPRPEPSRSPAAAPAKGGDYQVQLGALRSADRAGAQARRLTRRLKDVLKGAKVRVVRADLGRRGIFYRLRAGPVGDRKAAAAICRTLAKRKLGCMVVKP